MTPLTELEGKALALPPEEREQLAGTLLRSLQEEPLSDIDEDWLQVAENRYAEYKAGKHQGIPSDQVFEEIRKEFGWSKN